MKKFSFIIVAGGKGSRMGGEKKQFVKLNDRPLWCWSADNAAELYEAGISEIILVVPSDYDFSDEKNSWHNQNVPLRIVHGGSERAESVLNGLKAAAYEYVMVHDAARPFASRNLLLSLMEATTENAGAIPVLPVADALKKIENKEILRVERDGLFITQTPQSFPKEKLILAVMQNLKAKDEAEAWLESHHELNDVEGERFNFKITWQEDMLMAKSLVNQKITRTGLGYDIHRLVPERKLILGGVFIENSPLGLLGHSDADLLTHAIMDAILGAAGLADIGNIFPASDEKFKNANSIKLLEKVINLVENENWKIEFIDAVVQAQVPKLNKYREEIINNLKKFFTMNLKFKSAEETDDAGKGLSMTCWAVATLTKEI